MDTGIGQTGSIMRDAWESGDGKGRWVMYSSDKINTYELS